MAEFRTSTGLATCTPFMRTSTGLVEIKAPMMRNTNGTLVAVGKTSSPFSATVSPDYASGAVAQNRPILASTNTVTAAGKGGTAPYTYAWTVTDPRISISNASGPDTQFRATVNAGDYIGGTGTCLVKDSSGASASVSVDINLYNDGRQTSGQIQ